MPLTVGDAVHILEENYEWYRGYAVREKGTTGIFPKTYIHKVECTIDRNGPTPIFTLQQPHIVQEITFVLREWGTLWKDLYIVSVKTVPKTFVKLFFF